jgi:hypothetical protein
MLHVVHETIAVGVFARDTFTDDGDKLSCCLGWNTTTDFCLDGIDPFTVRSGAVLNNWGSLAASVVTASATASTAAATGAQDNCSDSSAAEIGIGVGLGVPLLAALIALGFLLFRRKSMIDRTKAHDQSGGGFSRDQKQHKGYYPTKTESSPVELSAPTQRSELQ